MEVGSKFELGVLGNPKWAFLLVFCFPKRIFQTFLIVVLIQSILSFLSYPLLTYQLVSAQHFIWKHRILSQNETLVTWDSEWADQLDSKNIDAEAT